MAWVHCNKCFSLPKENYGQFSVTNCGHIFCYNCLVTGEKGMCCLCNKRCASMFINGDMKENIKMYFTSQSVLLDNYIKVKRFQDNHRRSFQNHVRLQYLDYYRKYLTEKQKINKQQLFLAQIQQANVRLKLKLRSLNVSYCSNWCSARTAPSTSRSGTNRSERNVNDLQQRLSEFNFVPKSGGMYPYGTK